MKLEFPVDPAAWRAAMDARARQVRSAQRRALNRTAEGTQGDLKEKVKQTFFQVTPWVLNSTRVKYASNSNLEAVVAFKDAYVGGAKLAPVKTLQVQVDGGTRPQKRAERRLSFLSGTTVYMMPARFAELDRYGNPRPSQLVKILSVLGALDPGNNRNRKRRQRGRRRNEEYFAIFRRGEGDSFRWNGDALAPGIYRKGAGGRPLPVYVFMKGAPTYRPRLAWRETAERSVSQRLPAAFADELRKV